MFERGRRHFINTPFASKASGKNFHVSVFKAKILCCWNISKWFFESFIRANVTTHIKNK